MVTEYSYGNTAPASSGYSYGGQQAGGYGGSTDASAGAYGQQTAASGYGQQQVIEGQGLFVLYFLEISC